MKKDELQVLMDARKLAIHTLKITNNLNNFPKKYRFTLVDRLVSCAFNIYDYAYEANLHFGQERIDKQTDAIINCGKLKNYLIYVQEVLKPQCSIQYWNEMIETVEQQLIRWRKFTKTIK